MITESDVILQVIDARDPMGFRSKPLEDLIKMTHIDKKLVLVVNKIG